MMAVNRYRIKSLADNGHRSAALVLKLLQSPDKLLGTILFGNNVANIAASTLATVIGLRLFGDIGLAYAPMILVFIVLIFAEVAPKTLAALHPETIAFPASWVLSFLQILLSPFVWIVKVFSNGFLKLFGVQVTNQSDALTSEELHAAVRESDDHLDTLHKDMLLRVLEMEHVTVEDAMVPRADIEAIDINDDWDEIVEQLSTSHHTRVPVFEETLDNLMGIAHIRKVFYQSQTDEFNKESFIKMIREPYFIPENSSISHALENLQAHRHRFGIVVDEYGDIKGLITLEQILEEIVGKFTTVVPGTDLDIRQEEDQSYLVKGNTFIRDINRNLDWNLPTDGAKTINGLVFEYLEDIPQANMGFKIANYVFEIIQTRESFVQAVKIKQIQ